MAALLKIGLILVQEGIITETQLENILAVQKKYPQRTVGEIASQILSISENEIETIFANKILAEAVRVWLYERISNKIPGVDLKTIVHRIDIIIKKFTRLSIAQKDFALKQDQFFHPSSEKKFLSKIHCTIDSIVLKTNFNEDIIFKEIFVVYDVQEQRITFENESIILESKIKIMQQVKKFKKMSEAR